MSDSIVITDAPKVKKSKRVFMWFFFVVQIIFVIWLISGIASAHTTPDHAQVVAGCHHGAWQGLFKSQKDCMTHYANGLKQAGQAGTAIGAGLVFLLWIGIDMLLGISRLVVLTARRHNAKVSAK